MNFKKSFSLIKRIILLFVAILVTAIVIMAVYILVMRPPEVSFEDDNSTEKIIVFGDTRSNYTTHNKIVNLIDNEEPDMVIHTGDMINVDTQIQTQFLFMIVENKLWDNAEFFATRGNHEESKDIFNFLFRTPDDKTYYSFDRMGIHFIILDVPWHNQVMNDEAKQLEWLKKDLTANKGKPKIVAMHAPMETTGKYSKFYLEGLHELFLENDVIATVSAHVHSYERSDRDGIQYIVTAGGGAPLYPPTFENEYSVIREPFFHYVRIVEDDTDNGSYRFEAIDIDGDIFDNFTTSKYKLNN